MSIRPYSPRDRAELIRLRAAHGEHFWFADPDGHLQPETLVAEDQGHVVGALTGRHTLEAFLMLDPAWRTPRERWCLVRQLAAEGSRAAWRSGFQEIHLFTSDTRFARRLATLPAVFPDPRHHLYMNLCRLPEHAGAATAAER